MSGGGAYGDGEYPGAAVNHKTIEVDVMFTASEYEYDVQ